MIVVAFCIRSILVDIWNANANAIKIRFSLDLFYNNVWEKTNWLVMEGTRIRSSEGLSINYVIYSNNYVLYVYNHLTI